MNQNPTGPVAQVFSSYTPEVRARLLELRRLILRVAKSTPGVGQIEEALRWNQPSYLTQASGSGSTIRLDEIRARPGQYALYFHCQTKLISSFRKKYGTALNYGGNRALIFSVADALPTAVIEACVRDALTYHAKRRKPRIPIGNQIK